MTSSKKAYNQAFVEAATSKHPSSSELLQVFLRPVNTSINASNKAFEDALSEAWQDVTSLARQIPHDQQGNIVSLVDELRNQPGPVKENGEKVKIWEEEVEWKQLPMLGPELRECWNTSPQGSEEPDKSWVNLNTFVARLTALSSPGDSLDNSLYAIWTFRDALEESDLSGKLPNISILQAAAVWMVYAGSALRERAKSNYSFDGKLAREGKSLEGKGWTGFSEARWDVWLKRFKLAKERCQDEKTRDLLAKVLSLYGEKGDSV